MSENGTLYLDPVADNWTTPGVFVGRIFALCILAVAATSLNLAILLITALTPRMRTTANLFFASMAIADIVMGSSNYLFIAYYGIHLSRRNVGRWLCNFWCTLDDTCGTVSLAHLLTISAHRVKSLVSPFATSRERNSCTKMAAICFVLWFLPATLWSGYYAVVSSGIIICDRNKYAMLTMASLTILYLIPMAGTLIMNIVVNVLLRRKSVISTSAKVRTGPVEVVRSTCHCLQGTKDKPSEKRERRATLVLTLCSAAFLATWIPVVVVWILQRVIDVRVPFWADFVTNCLNCAYPILEPSLLFIFNRSYRIRLKELVHRQQPAAVTASNTFSVQRESVGFEANVQSNAQSAGIPRLADGYLHCIMYPLVREESVGL